MSTQSATIKARHAEAGDVITHDGVLYMIRGGEPHDEDISRLTLRLSAGRTDPGHDVEFGGDDLVSIYRHGGLPKYALEDVDG